MSSRLFGVGVAGLEITPREREILARHPPWTFILFGRNIESVEQVRALASEATAMGALVSIDQEGGSVDRLARLFGPSISFRGAARAGTARLAGELAGEACARLKISIDLAPVVDRCLPRGSEEILRDRCVSPDPAAVAQAASRFLSGLHARGVGGCVKHFPGLGRAQVDTHRALPLIPEDPDEEALDLVPFAMTMNQAGAVMISHAGGPDGMPASLSPDRANDLLRQRLGFVRAAFSDDLEMGALAAFGDLPRICVAAAGAGCDLLFVCSRLEEYPACVEAVERDVPAGRRTQALERLDGYARDLAGLRESATLPDRPLDRLVEEIRELKRLERPA